MIGLIFGYGVKGQATGSFFFTRAFVSGKMIVFLFVCIVYYSYLLAPDWMWMYFVPAADFPSWMVFYVLIGYFFAYAVGFAITVEGRKFTAIYPPFLMIVMLLAEIAIIYALKDRYLQVGTFTDYIAKTTVPLAESTVGQAPAILSALLIPLAIGLILWSRKQTFS